MGKNKGSRIIVTLECKCDSLETEKRKSSVYRYTTSKNKRNTPNRLEIKKFCPCSNKHEIFKEIK